MTFSEVIGGVTVSDPFRWLEDDADPAVIEWQRAANERALKVGHLLGAPGGSRNGGPRQF